MQNTVYKYGTFKNDKYYDHECKNSMIKPSHKSVVNENLVLKVNENRA